MVMLPQYDTDVVTWSPQGRIHQVEYAMEAVKQGSTAVALKASRGFCQPLCLSAIQSVLEQHS